PSGTSPASFIATKRSRTPSSSATSWSKAMTSPPRRYISNAWRPAPQPMSSTRSPGLRPSRSKSTVSTSFPLGLFGPVVLDHFFIRSSGLRCDCAPTEILQHPLAAGDTHGLAPSGVVQQGSDRRRELPDVTRGDQVRALAVGSHHLGDRASPRDHQRG